MIPIAKPVLGEPEGEAARRAVLSGWVTQGPEVAAFEREFAAAIGAEHACAVANCTVALHLALLAVGVGPGDEVITASHSFIATANAIRYCGASPIFVDIEPDGYNMDPAAVGPAITARTKAILCVHQMGMPCDLATILMIARQHGVPVIEDAACAIGSEIFLDSAWQAIGHRNDTIVCFSFHPRKVITTGDGGMLTTASADDASLFRRLRQHGMNISDTARHASSQVVFEDYSEVGYNYRMTDIQAAVGRRQLLRLPEIVARRRALADRYNSLLADLTPELKQPFEPSWARSNWQSYCLRLPVRIGQRQTMQYLLEHGVATRRGIMCAHREPAYRDLQCRHTLRESERAQDHCILLPLYPEMQDDDQLRVVTTLRSALRTQSGSCQP